MDIVIYVLHIPVDLAGILFFAPSSVTVAIHFMTAQLFDKASELPALGKAPCIEEKKKQKKKKMKKKKGEKKQQKKGGERER